MEQSVAARSLLSCDQAFASVAKQSARSRPQTPGSNHHIPLPEATSTQQQHSRRAAQGQKFIGTRTKIVVPQPDAVRTFSCPPIFSARARMLENPNPSLLAA
jgi:hypothetical protein